MVRTPAWEGLLDGYPRSPAYDEMFGADGLPHPHMRALYDALQMLTGEDLAQRPAARDRSFLDQGFTFSHAGDPYALRIRELQLAQPLLKLLASGTRLMIEIEERIHSQSGIGSIALGIFHPDPGYTTPLVTWGVALGGESYAEAVPRTLAWADIRADTVPDEQVEWQAYAAEHTGVRLFNPVDWANFTAWRDSRPDSATLQPFFTRGTAWPTGSCSYDSMTSAKRSCWSMSSRSAASAG